jgi:hypothetical protein
MLETGKLDERSTAECKAIGGRALALPTDVPPATYEHHDGTCRRGYASLTVEQGAKPTDLEYPAFRQIDGGRSKRR